MLLLTALCFVLAASSPAISTVSKQEELLQAVNSIRAEYPNSADDIPGRPKAMVYNSNLAMDPTLSIKAQEYAKLCAEMNMGGHTVGGLNPQQRYGDRVGEAVALSTIDDVQFAKGLLKDNFIADPNQKEHYRLLLTPNLVTVGVGVHNANGNWCWVVAVPLPQ